MRARTRPGGPAVPVDGLALAHVVTEATKAAERVHRTFGLEPHVCLAPASRRSAMCVVTIPVDERDERRAARCFRAFAEQVLARGCSLYRLTGHSSKHPASRGEYVCVLGPSPTPSLRTRQPRRRGYDAQPAA